MLNNRQRREIRLIKTRFKEKIFGANSVRGEYYIDPFDQFKMIFIHIPKTAGTSIVHALLDGIEPGHKMAIEYQAADPEAFKKYYKFAFLRDPVARLYSSYSYLKRGGNCENDQRWSEKNLSGYDTFESFVKNWLSKDSVYEGIHFIPQYKFICDNKDKILVDDLAYFENLEGDFYRITRKVGISNKLKHINKTKAKKMMAVDQRVIDRIKSIYYKDYQLFNFS